MSTDLERKNQKSDDEKRQSTMRSRHSQHETNIMIKEQSKDKEVKNVISREFCMNEVEGESRQASSMAGGEVVFDDKFQGSGKFSFYNL